MMGHYRYRTGTFETGFDVIIPELLMEYNHPWIAQSIFVLQTAVRPFAWMAASHATFPEYKEGEFEIAEIDEPKKLGYMVATNLQTRIIKQIANPLSSH